MAGFLVKRLLALAGTLLVVSILTYTLVIRGVVKASHSVSAAAHGSSARGVTKSITAGG